MLKEMTAYDFYKDYEVEGFDSLGATCLIMPDEKFTVLNIADRNDEGKMIDGLGRHADTACEILKEKYNAVIDMDNISISLNNIIYGNMVIMISYVIQEGFQFVSINVPNYITSYQVEQLEEVNRELKQVELLLKEKYGDNSGKFLIGVTLGTSIRINNDFDGAEDFEKGKVNDPIKSILEYMKANGRIDDSIENSFRKNEKVGSISM